MEVFLKMEVIIYLNYFLNLTNLPPIVGGNIDGGMLLVWSLVGIVPNSKLVNTKYHLLFFVFVLTVVGTLAELLP